MRWLVFVLLSLSVIGIWRGAGAKASRTVTLAETDVATVQTALGYTTLLGFDGRPTSVVLGDQDAFKVEYVGNGLAIKPLQVGARTNLFVFTDSDRFNFRLIAGSTAEADYLLRVLRSAGGGYLSESRDEPGSPVQSKLIRKKLNRKAGCGGITLGVRTIAWPESQSTLLIQFRVEVTPSLVKRGELRFQPGDFELKQDGRSLPIESLHLERLQFSSFHRIIDGTLVLRQSELSNSRQLELAFFPDLLKAKHPGCPKISFSRQGVSPGEK